MNKKLLVLTVLPALLLSACGGEKQITAAEAKDVAAKMVEKQKTLEPSKELSIVMNQKSSATSSASISSFSGSSSYTKASTLVVQYSLEKNYFHVVESDKSSLSYGGYGELWTFVDSGYLYEFVYTSTNLKTTREATKRKLTEAETKAWDFSKYVYGLSQYAVYATEAFTIMLEGLAEAATEQPEQQEEGVKTTISYFSSGEGNLHVAAEAVYANAEEEIDGVKGQTSGKATTDVVWEDNLPVSYEVVSELNVAATEAGTTVTVTTESETSVYLQYKGVMIEFPDRTQYSIKDLDKADA